MTKPSVRKMLNIIYIEQKNNICKAQILPVSTVDKMSPGTILYARILLKLDDDEESLYGIENSRTRASETRGYNSCAPRHILS